MGILIRKEILDQVSSRRFLILGLLSCAIVLLSILEGAFYFLRQQDVYNTNQRHSNERVRQIVEAPRSILPDRNYWGEFFSYGYRVHKPPTPLSIFVRGLDPIQGKSAIVLGNRDLSPARSPAAENPLLAVFPTLDLATVVEAVLALFVLLLGYDAICGERQQGTLSLTTSFAVSRSHIFIAKAVGTCLPALIAFAIPALLGMAVVVSLPQVEMNGSEWSRLLFILAGFCLYLVAVSCVGVSVSALTRRPATSFVVLLAFWTVAVIVIPRISLIAADTVAGAPSVAKYSANRRAVSRDIMAAERERSQEWEAAYREQHDQSPWWSWQGMKALYDANSDRRKEWLPRRNAAYRQVDQAFLNRFHRWYDLGVRVGRLSPAFALHNSLVRLAGTGVEQERAFMKVYAEHIAVHEGWIEETFHEHTLRKHAPRVFGTQVWDVADVPRMNYVRTWDGADFGSALVDYAVLVLWAVLCLVLGILATLRYDVRP